jgi:CubicO group peptidase (beta-lactamase class C family)
VTKFLWLCVVLSLGCDALLQEDGDSEVSLEENLSPPPATEDGWPVSDLEPEGIRGEAVRDLVRQIQLDPQRVDSLLIVRNGKLVLETYFGGWQRERLHELRSCSKSVNSLLVGIAIDRGLLDGVQHPVLDLFPQYAAMDDEPKAAMRVEHLLTMSSGLKWDQTSFDNADPRNDEGMLERSDDWLQYVLSREMQDTPGDVFLYNSGCSALLAGIVKQTTGEHSDVFAEQYLFGPLGIQQYFWQKQADGLCNAWAGLSLRSRDMAKMGQLMLDHGRWQGQQIVSEEWVARSTTALQFRGETGYGYQWWTGNMSVEGVDAKGVNAESSVAPSRTVRVHSALGNGGQYIFIVPELNAVVVFTGSNYAPLDAGAPFGFMSTVVLPAMM